jgi:drug/metabolite transporter (DMT)-like permease
VAGSVLGPQARLVAAFAAVYLIWGSTYLAIRWSVESLPPMLMAGARHVVAGLVLYAWARRAGAVAPTSRHWAATTVVGAALLLGGNGGVTWAAQFVASGLIALIVATVPLWMVVFQWATEGRRVLNRTTGAGVLLGLAGVALLVDPRAEGGIAWVPMLVVVGAAIAWAGGSLYARRAPMPESPILGTGMELLAGGALLVLVGLGLGEAATFDPAAVTTRSLLSFVYLVFLGSIVGFSAYIYLLNHTTPAKASTYAYVNPVVAVILGTTLAGEALTGRTLLAGAVILAGVVLIGVARPGARKSEETTWTTTTSGST